MNYEKPEMDVTIFRKSDVITDSIETGQADGFGAEGDFSG